MLGELKFASLLTYSPRGQSAVSVNSRRVRDKVKGARAATLETAARRMSERLLENPDYAFLKLGRCTLVPTPRSAPLTPSALWPAFEICKVLMSHHLAASCLPCVNRVRAVPKSAFAAPGERPSVQDHFDSLDVDESIERPDTIIVVDDFVTKGSTLIATASKVSQAFPDSEVYGFALVRTMGLRLELESILDPCVGVITLNAGEAIRRP